MGNTCRVCETHKVLDLPGITIAVGTLGILTGREKDELFEVEFRGPSSVEHPQEPVSQAKIFVSKNKLIVMY